MRSLWGPTIRGRLIQAGWGLAALAALASCSPQAPAGLIDIAACRRLTLLDGEARVLGVEDMVYDAHSSWLVVSAYDRLAVEQAEKGVDAPEPPHGGLYVLDATSLGQASIAVRDILGPALGAKGRPHGVDAQLLQNGMLRIAVVNRAFVRGESGTWRLRPEIDLLDVGTDGASVAARVLSARLCSANDVSLLEPDRVMVTLDRGVCIEDGRQPVGGPAMAIATTEGAVRTAPAPVGFPNGVVASAGETWMAGTLDRVLSTLDGGRRVAMLGAPDNLTSDPEGRLVAALHPQLWRFAPHRYGWWLFDRAPSRIVRFDPRRRTIATLFEDQTGMVFSGATVAAVVDKQLVLGGVREEGVLVCPLPEAAQ